jgi:hypothetical protein
MYEWLKCECVNRRDWSLTLRPSQIATEFGMSDEERDWKLGGWTSAAFFLVGSPFSVIIGHLTDTSNR